MALPLANAGGPYATIPYGSIPTTQALTGSGTPGTGAASIVSYSWTIIDQPPASGSTLSSGAVQNPTLNGITVTGTVRVFLVVTDDLGNVSETDPSAAPDEAFADVAVSTQYLALIKPAASERNWTDDVNEWCDALDVTAGLFAPATTTTQGTVQLSEDPADAAAPVAVTRDRMLTTERATGKIAATTMAGNPAQSLLQFPIYESCTLVGATYAFADGGVTTRTNYVIDFYHQSSAEFSANTFNVGDKVITFTVGAPGTSNIPINGVSATISRAMIARDVVSVVISSADADAADQGSDLVVTLLIKKEW
jgi:hypothetical protein